MSARTRLSAAVRTEFYSSRLWTFIQNVYVLVKYISLKNNNNKKEAIYTLLLIAREVISAIGV